MTEAEIKKICNEKYGRAITLMEACADSLIEVRNLLLDVAELLQQIKKLNPLKRAECDLKSKKLLLAAKAIAVNGNFAEAYRSLTGADLPSGIVPAKDLTAPENDRKVSPADNFKSEESIGDLSKNPVYSSINDGFDESVAAKTDGANACPKGDNSACDVKSDDTEQAGINAKNRMFNWDEKPTVSFKDVAGLDEVKSTVENKVLLPLKNPELFDGYTKTNGGGILLYGPPGTGKTMIAAAIAHEINAKFCSVGPSDLLTTGVGNSEKLIATLFKEARGFKCSVIFFDEFESLCPVSTRAQHARQIRSELLKQMQGLDAYGKTTGGILLLIGATNKPWDIDPAFIRPGRLGTRVYVDLPGDDAREYMLNSALDKIRAAGKVEVKDICVSEIVEKTAGFNGADVTNLIDKAQEISIRRAQVSGIKSLNGGDFTEALKTVVSSVQKSDILKLEEWKREND